MSRSKNFVEDLVEEVQGVESSSASLFLLDEKREKRKLSLAAEKIFTDEAGEIIFKSFSDTLSLVSGTYYPPRSKKILNLINRIKKTKFGNNVFKWFS